MIGTRNHQAAACARIVCNRPRQRRRRRVAIGNHGNKASTRNNHARKTRRLLRALAGVISYVDDGTRIGARPHLRRRIRKAHDVFFRKVAVTPCVPAACSKMNNRAHLHSFLLNKGRTSRATHTCICHQNSHSSTSRWHASSSSAIAHVDAGVAPQHVPMMRAPSVAHCTEAVARASASSLHLRQPSSSRIGRLA